MLFVGVGEKMNDLRDFDPNAFVAALFAVEGMPAPERPARLTVAGVRAAAARLTAMFDALSDRLRIVLAGLTGHGRITEDDVDVAMREIRLALLEADVNYKVVKDFVKRVKERAIGARGHRERQRRPDGGQDRPRGADRHPRRRRPHLPLRRLTGGHRHGRPAGLGQDDLVGQAGPLDRAPGPAAAAGGRRPLPPGGGRPAQDAGPEPRHPGLQRAAGHAAWSTSPRRRGRGPPARAATWSSSTPPAGCRWTTR